MPDREPIDVPAPKPNPGMATTDDHIAGAAPDRGHQPTEGIDEGVAAEHISASSQGVRPEEPTGAAPGPSDEATGGGPSGPEESEGIGGPGASDWAGPMVER